MIFKHIYLYINIFISVITNKESDKMDEIKTFEIMAEDEPVLRDAAFLVGKTIKTGEEPTLTVSVRQTNGEPLTVTFAHSKRTMFDYDKLIINGDVFANCCGTQHRETKRFKFCTGRKCTEFLHITIAT